ncbi:MAG: hypothetical protein U0263_01450 [Polyangiaceae bacterium]
MNHWARSPDARAKAWAFLRHELSADIALVQEAVPPPDLDAVYKPIDRDNPRLNWGTAVVSVSGKYPLRPRTRRFAHAPEADGELIESHPGATAVADIIDPATGEPRIVAVSFYGAWEYLPKDPTKPKQQQAIYSATTSHRNLSDLSPLLVWARTMPHKIPVVLAGDFNATTQVAARNHWECEIEEAKVLFARLKALALQDLIAFTRDSRARLAACSCSEPDVCSHVRTYRHDNQEGSRPTQLDYVFASEPLLAQMSAFKVLDEDAAWSLSDHCPLVVDLRDP